MAKLKNVLEGKSSGEYFTTEEVENKLLIVVEEMNPDVEIREHDTGKKQKDKKTGVERPVIYYCLCVNMDGVVKDLHVTWTGLGQIAAVMPVSGSWKGQQFMITAVKTKGKLDIVSKGLAAPGTYQTQTIIPQTKDKNPLVIDASTQLLRMVANSTSGMSEVEFWKHAEHVTGGNLSGAMAMVEHLKAKGELFQDKDGFWRVVNTLSGQGKT